ncbi:MAG: AraC family transcriptional regulator [Bacteroidota bacterium]
MRQFIEDNFRHQKNPSGYAELLHISTSALGKMVKKRFGKTLTQMIQERIVIEAKRDLVLTGKLVKEIANDLGYNDPYYFSRIFKKSTTVSPEEFRLRYKLT